MNHPHARGPLRIKRAFGWGLLLLMDRDARAVPDTEGDSVISATEEGLAILVHHAQDVDFNGLEDDELVPLAEVEVQIHVGNAHRGKLTSAAPSQCRPG